MSALRVEILEKIPFLGHILIAHLVWLVAAWVSQPSHGKPQNVEGQQADMLEVLPRHSLRGGAFMAAVSAL
jgi:hypothetical protein